MLWLVSIGVRVGMEIAARADGAVTAAGTGALLMLLGVTLLAQNVLVGTTALRAGLLAAPAGPARSGLPGARPRW